MVSQSKLAQLNAQEKFEQLLQKKATIVKNRIPNSQIPKKKKKRIRCERRAFEVIYDNVPEDISQEAVMAHLKKNKYGIWKAFSVMHRKRGNQECHLHVGIVFRNGGHKDPIKDLYNDQLKGHFTIPGHVPSIHVPLKYGGKMLGKLQKYWDYCHNEKDHPDQDILDHYLWRFEPLTTIEKMTPSDYFIDLIRAGMTPEEFDDLLYDHKTPNKIFKYGISNYDKIQKMISDFEDICTRKANIEKYKKAAETYRPNQLFWKKVLDTQDDRGIHLHYDPGKTGKNHFIRVESLRLDTCVIHSSQTKRMAAVWNPRIHKRIIFDIPKGSMQYLNTIAVEALKNGLIFASMHHPKMKESTFKPTIIILGNEEIADGVWTEDRLSMSTSKYQGHTITKSSI